MKGFCWHKFLRGCFSVEIFFVAFALFLAVPLNVGKLRWIKTSRVFLLPPQEDIVCLEGTGPNTVVSN